MLVLNISGGDLFNEETEEFIPVKSHTIQLEHSLVSISKWESKWCKSFLSSGEKTYEETVDYIKCMTVTPNVDPNLYRYLTQEHIKKVNDYIIAPMTATTFSETKGKGNSRSIITSEVIYYQMVAYNIPFECEKWHLNRLLTLIKVCSIKNEPPKKMGKRELMSRNAALNAARRQRLNSKG